MWEALTRDMEAYSTALRFDRQVDSEGVRISEPQVWLGKACLYVVRSSV